MAKSKTNKSDTVAVNEPRFKKSELSINDIRGLAWAVVSKGDDFSYEILKEQNRKLAKLANNRLRLLEKADLDLFAYDRAMTYLETLDKVRFPTDIQSKTFEGMIEQLSELISFVNSKTSTVSGARKALQNKLNKISEYTGTTYTKDQEKALGQLLGLDSVSTLLRDIRGNSGEVIEALEDLALVDVDKSEITKIIDRYLQGWQPFADTPWALKSLGMNYDELLDALRELYKRGKTE